MNYYVTTSRFSPLLASHQSRLRLKTIFPQKKIFPCSIHMYPAAHNVYLERNMTLFVLFFSKLDQKKEFFLENPKQPIKYRDQKFYFQLRIIGIGIGRQTQTAISACITSCRIQITSVSEPNMILFELVSAFCVEMPTRRKTADYLILWKTGQSP